MREKEGKWRCNVDQRELREMAKKERCEACLAPFFG